ncbi:MAG: M48 family metalloprotease [Magnetococcales bacterium]|nr:M48 family metalloprotease [Magnetococcales bacterium]
MAEPTTGSDVFALLEKKYGVIDPLTHPLVARVQKIFVRVQDAADKRGNRMPRLSVLNRPEVPWAFALPDGNIILSLGAVRLCYRSVTQAEGDTRIAFVLGHELAHLTKNDFWEMEVYQAIAGSGQSGDSRSLTVPEELRQRQAVLWNQETEADDLGFLYAGIAGYPVQTLLVHEDKSRENFFSLWNQQARGDPTLRDLHPPPDRRAAFLRGRLDRLTRSMAFFRFGMRLAALGHCEQAILLFRHFLQVFPSREVFNNLGACHLQRARKGLEATATGGSAYWLPLLFDASTRAEILTAGQPIHLREEPLPLPPVLPDKTGHELEQAVDYLEQAVTMDATYLPARLNLATVHFYRGEMLKARSVVKEALRLAPNSRDVAGWHALIFFLDSQENGLGAAALPSLTRLASQGDAPASLIYNHAVLTRELGKNNRSNWRRLAALLTPLPARYARMACQMAKVSCPAAQTSQEKRFPWPLPVQPGADLDTGAREKLFSGWLVTPLGWLEEKQPGIAYRRGEDLEVLDRDGYVAMVVLRGGILGTTQLLKKKMGNPTHVRPMAEGELWSYGDQWAVLVRDGRLREAWVVGNKP